MPRAHAMPSACTQCRHRSGRHRATGATSESVTPQSIAASSVEQSLTTSSADRAAEGTISLEQARRIFLSSRIRVQGAAAAAGASDGQQDGGARGEGELRLCCHLELTDWLEALVRLSAAIEPRQPAWRSFDHLMHRARAIHTAPGSSPARARSACTRRQRAHRPRLRA